MLASSLQNQVPAQGLPKANGLFGILLESTGDAKVSVRNIHLKNEDH
jgi:hypothetical protein